ncbi:hypothetical protein [Bradyrhizobium genosp. P]|uniref:hypothetical protein n=1 Tax=Bradyrhizobium genosp. P TaxID=83641 RepID=UPI003CEFAE5D
MNDSVRSILFIVTIIAFMLDPAAADVTTCFGNGNCTVVTPDGAHQMSRSEILIHQRDQQERRVAMIECEYASGFVECERLRTALSHLFH